MSSLAPPETRAGAAPAAAGSGGADPRRWRRVAAALLVAALVVASAVLLTTRPWAGGGTPSRTESTLTRLEHQPMSAQAGPNDIGFADVMLSYVQQADQIVLLAQGRPFPAELVAKANRLVEDLHRLRSTQADILTRMLAAWKMLSVHQTHTHQVGTMLTPDELAELQGLPDEQFPTAWASVLIEHWHGMVPLAQDEVRNGTNGQTRDLANDLITDFGDYVEELAAIARG